jgi:WD40 repeat protein
VEITHEALFREWPRLRRWLDEDLQGRRLHQRVGETARSWIASGRDRSELLRGTRLAAADEWALRHGDELNDIETELLDASRAEMQRELRESAARADRESKANRRLRRLLAAAAVLAVLAAATGAVAFSQRDRARSAAEQAENARSSAATARVEAEQQADRFAMTSLLAQSEAARANDRDLAALLAVAAHRIEPGTRSLSALFGLFTDTPGIERTIRLDGVRLVRMALFPDEQRVAVLDDAHVVRVLDLDSGSVVQTFEPTTTSNGAGRLAVSPDGRRIAAAAFDALTGSSWLSLWDVGRGTRIAQPVEVGFYPNSIDFSHDGSLVAVAGGSDGDALVVDGATGDRVVTVPGSVTTGDRVLVARNAAAIFLADGTLAISSAGAVSAWERGR